MKRVPEEDCAYCVAYRERYGVTLRHDMHTPRPGSKSLYGQVYAERFGRQPEPQPRSA